MTKAALVARLKKEFAAEDYFTGVLGNRHSVYLPRPKPARRSASVLNKRSAAKSDTARRSRKTKAAAG